MPVPTPIRIPVVACKGCSALVPTETRALPPEAVAVLCPLCKEHRQYRPSEVFLWLALLPAADRGSLMGFDVGGFTQKPNWPRLRPTLVIASSLILAIRTARPVSEAGTHSNPGARPRDRIRRPARRNSARRSGRPP